MLIKVFSTVFPVFAIIGLGYAYGRIKKPDLAFANQINMDIFIPALVFFVLSGKNFDLLQYQWLALAGAAVILLPGLLAWPFASIAKASPKTFIPPMMFNNSGNMGLPLAILAFGEHALAAAVVLFIVEMTLHITVGIYMLDRRSSFWRILRMPMMIATIAGLVFSVMKWELPLAVHVPMEMLSQVSIPLLLFSLGVRLVDVDLRDWRAGAVGAVICPLTGILAALPFIYLLPLTELQTSLLLVFAALPPAVMNYVIAEQYNQEPRKVASIVLLGNLAAIITVPAMVAYVL